jgi:hypothetical protein
MGASPETIWRVPAYLPDLQPPLTDVAVAAAEREIGYKLPSEYLDLLRKQNGGYIRYSLPELQLPHDSIAGIGPRLPSLSRPDWEEDQEHVSFPLEGLVPFDGDGHWHICLDYRKNLRIPGVTYLIIERDREGPIASSFADYLAMLQLDTEDQYVLEAVSSLGVVKSSLSSALSIRFEPPDSWAHGYPVHRARLGTEDDPEWLWISPNTVPRGFVREDDPRYAELKDLLPGFADRFPELPPGSYTIGTTDGVRSKVIEACERSGFHLQPLSSYMSGI